jgi:hypothetical protein
MKFLQITQQLYKNLQINRKRIVGNILKIKEPKLEIGLQAGSHHQPKNQTLIVMRLRKLRLMRRM